MDDSSDESSWLQWLQVVQIYVNLNDFLSQHRTTWTVVYSLKYLVYILSVACMWKKLILLST